MGCPGRTACRYFSDFSLIKGRGGRLGINYRVETQEQAVAELSSRVFSHANDEINIDEKVTFAGKFQGTK